jgi:cyclopropane-fatty-acyl-phospholipid synthase
MRESKVKGEATTGVAAVLEPMMRQVLGGPVPIPVHFWDGSTLGEPDDKASVRINSINGIRRMIYAPGTLGLGRAYTVGDIDFDGDIVHALRKLQWMRPKLGRLRTRTGLQLLAGAAKIGAFGRPLPVPEEEARKKGRFLHLRHTDKEAISHHYDIPSEFYALFLGESMAYTGARYPHAAATLDEAQFAKYDLICRKLDLSEGKRLLDVGCGWGGLAMFAARNYGVSVVGVTLSSEQADWACRAIDEAGLSSKIDIRVMDYRDLVGSGERFDGVSAVGILEHIGAKQSVEFFTILGGLLKDNGRLLNQAISKVGGAAINTFGDRYVFPDGELQDVGNVVLAVEAAGLEVRDVEGLRDHYAWTCEAWTRNLEANWDRAVELVGLGRARVWRLYMAASAVFFQRNRLGLFQTLAVRTPESGESGMPYTRESYA